MTFTYILIIIYNLLERMPMPVKNVDLIPTQHPEFAYTNHLIKKIDTYKQIQDNMRVIALTYAHVVSLYKKLSELDQEHNKNLQDGQLGEELAFPDILEKEPVHE